MIDTLSNQFLLKAFQKLKDIFLMSCCSITTLHLNLRRTVQVICICKIKSKENPQNVMPVERQNDK